MAGKIATPIRNRDAVITNLIVYNADDVKALNNYRQMLKQLKLIESGLKQGILDYAVYKGMSEGTLKASVFGGAGAAGKARAFGVAQIASSIISNWLPLFKSDLEFKNEAITFEEEELVSALVAHLKNPNTDINIYYPKRVPPSILNCPADDLETCSPMLAQITKTDEAYTFASLLVEEINTEIEVAKAAAKDCADDACRAPHLAATAVLTAHKRKLDRFIELYLGTMKQLGIEGKKDDKGGKGGAVEPAGNQKPGAPEPAPSKTPCCGNNTTVNVNMANAESKEESAGSKSASSGGAATSGLYNLLRAESIEALMKDNGYWLDLKVTGAGGSVRQVKNIMTSIFYNSRVNFSGGVTGYFHIYDINGKTLIAGHENYYHKYQKSKSINK